RRQGAYHQWQAHLRSDAAERRRFDRSFRREAEFHFPRIACLSQSGVRTRWRILQKAFGKGVASSASTNSSSPGGGIAFRLSSAWSLLLARSHFITSRSSARSPRPSLTSSSVLNSPRWTHAFVTVQVVSLRLILEL